MLSGCGDDVDVHADVGGDSAHGLPDVAFGAEPQLTPIRESGGEGFGDEQPSGRIASGDGRGTVEQRPRVEHLEHFRMREADDIEITAGKGGKELGELPGARRVDTLQQSPVTCGGKRELVVGKSVWPIAAYDAHRQVLVDHEQRSGRIVGMVVTE